MLRELLFYSVNHWFEIECLLAIKTTGKTALPFAKVFKL